MDDGPAQLDYMRLFRRFVQLRRFKLLRYLFGLRQHFEFNFEVFHAALEEDAYDVAALLYQEFSYLMRSNSPEETRQIVQYCV